MPNSDAPCSPSAVSIIIPYRNAERTLARTLDSLFQQDWQGAAEILLIDDNSTDNSTVLALQHPICGRWPVLVHTNTAKGLANGYNVGITKARYDHVIIMHADCYVAEPASISRLLAYFDDPSVVGVMPLCHLPIEVWKGMSFWDRVAHSRYIEKVSHGFGGKFDGIKKSAIRSIGGFDAAHFFSAGEDSDIAARLTTIGKLAPSTVTVVHAHYYPPDTRLQSLFRKQAQLGEGFGALMAKHWRHLGNPAIRSLFVMHMTKLALILCLVTPYTFTPAAGLLFALGCYYSWRACLTLDARVILVPFVNMALMTTFCLAMIRGMAHGRQDFDYNIRHS